MGLDWVNSGLCGLDRFWGVLACVGCVALMRKSGEMIHRGGQICDFNSCHLCVLSMVWEFRRQCLRYWSCQKTSAFAVVRANEWFVLTFAEVASWIFVIFASWTALLALIRHRRWCYIRLHSIRVSAVSETEKKQRQRHGCDRFTSTYGIQKFRG